MSLPQCTCSAPCVSPATCFCVYKGPKWPVVVKCNKCRDENTAFWAVKSNGEPWRALGLKCPCCGYTAMISFAGLPEKLQAEIRLAVNQHHSGGAESKPAPANRGAVGKPVSESETFRLRQ